ncbi:MAG: glucosaminidase domain-containing protein, partial [Chitinophagaceae bacterium]|nr:glucosaminidase domain-containing protein [Chitinophagaceae bacterium]
MRIFSVVLFMLIAGLVKAQPAADIIEYINTYKKLAIDEMQRAGVPAAVKLAQGIHETQAGKSDLVQKSNNHFGIKCKAIWTGDRVFHDDDSRGECFRKYGQAADSYRDHSDFLRGSDRYDFLFQLDPTDYKAWAFGLKKAGYATNPKYAPIIIKLIEDYNLEQYTLIAMGKLPPSDEALVNSIANTGNTSSIVTQAVKPGAASSIVKEIPQQRVTLIRPVYPPEEFTINNAKVVFVKEGTALLSVAEEHHLSFA